MIIEHKKYTVEVERTYVTSRKKIVGLFKNKTFMKLTGADSINWKFDKSEEFILIFNGRGKITGYVVGILKDTISLSWDVEGFNLPNESSQVWIYIDIDGKKCTLTIIHEGIKLEESAKMKDKAWTELLEDLEKELKRI